MMEIIKKHWFVGLIGILLFAGAFYFTADALKTDVKAKQNEEGQDVVFSYNEKNYTADDMYEEVFQTLDIGVIIPVLEVEVYRDAMEISEAIKNNAKTKTDNIITSLKTEYGEKWEFALDRLLIQSGYVNQSGVKGLEDYLTILEIRSEIEQDYIKNNDSVVKAFMEESQPRMISHILIDMRDSENPTERELKKLEEAKAALAKDGANFASVASEFSDDSSASRGGSLGLVTKDSIEQFVERFKEQVYTVGENETTEWFNTEYGYHVIHVDAVDIEGFERLNNTDFYNLIFDANPEILLDITWDQIQKQNISFGDNQDLAKAITAHYTAKEEN